MRNEFCQFGRLKKRRKKSKSLTMYFLKQKPKLWRMSNSFYSIFFFFFRIQNATMMMLMWNNNYRKQKSEKIKKKNYSQKAKESTQQTRQGVHATHYIYSTQKKENLEQHVSAWIFSLLHGCSKLLSSAVSIFDTPCTLHNKIFILNAESHIHISRNDKRLNLKFVSFFFSLLLWFHSERYLFVYLLHIRMQFQSWTK